MKETALLPFDDQWIARWQAQPAAERRNLNRQRLQANVVSFDELVDSPRPGPEKFTESLFFTHVPKAGGTTLEHVIAQNYRPHDVLHINGPVWRQNPYTLFKRGRDEPAKVVMGHFHLGDPIFQWLTAPIIHLVMIREPVERLVSYYRYLGQRSAHPLHRLATALPLHEFVVHPDVAEARNGQTRRLAGLIDEGAEAQPTTADALATQESLLREFSIVGVTNQFDALQATLEQLLGVRFFDPGPRNVTKQKARPTDRDVTAIQQCNELDAQLYEAASLRVNIQMERLDAAK